MQVPARRASRLYTPLMSGAYRESAAVTRAPLAQIAWRRRVGRGAVLLSWVLGAGMIVIAFWGRLLRGHDLAAALVEIVLNVGLIRATWLLSERRPYGPGQWSSWSLRGIVILTAVIVPLAALGLLRPGVAAAAGLVGGAAALAYVARFFDAAADARRARGARATALGLLFIAVFTWRPSTSADALTAIEVAGPFFAWWLLKLFVDFKSLVNVVSHEWWLDDAAAVPGRWVSLLVYTDKHAEVIPPDAPLSRFASRDEAHAWLGRGAFVEGSRAVQRGLVVSTPPKLRIGVPPRWWNRLRRRIPRRRTT